MSLVLGIRRLIVLKIFFCILIVARCYQKGHFILVLSYVYLCCTLYILR